ncbi:MAG TPA: polyhydroxyalkanoic acid system family protein [Polyangiaceae bacterium]|jgi:putative polyhydroxyalkanoate system protein
MSTIDIKRDHSLPKEEAKKRAEELAKSLESKFNLVWRWEGDSIRFDAPSGVAKGTKGEVSVSDKTVRVQIDLPMLLRMMKGTVESKVNEKLAQIL